MIVRKLTRWTVLAGFVILLALILWTSFISVRNTPHSSKRTGPPTILAHRGIGQRFDIPIESERCTAEHMRRPAHDYLENTIRSMQAAFDSGADVVEFDIHPTTDGHFAVFHDRRLDCKTNGHGLTRSHTIEELKALDIGYGYTFDGGRTFPFRGNGVGLMPTMDEVFDRFPDRSFLLHIKGTEPKDAALLAAHLSTLSAERRSKLMVFGRGAVLVRLHQTLPDLRVFSAGSVANCLVRYIVYGWTGSVPSACQNAPVWVPINLTPWLWGWPNRFLDRMDGAHAFIIVMGAYPSWEISPGVDTLQDLGGLPAITTAASGLMKCSLFRRPLKALAAPDT
jgi:glycerophosphoryl diester phosphodiesterase